MTEIHPTHPIHPTTVESRESKTSPILDDQPSEQDHLDFKSYVKALKDLIVHTDTKTPLTLGIFGRWGTGKTTLMQMLEGELKAEGLSTVWFNAWQYGKEDELWAAFLQSLLNKVDNQFRLLSKLWFRIKLLVNRVEWRNFPGWVLLYLFKIFIVILPLLLIDPLAQQVEANAEPILRLGGGLVTAGLAIWIVIKPFVNAIRENVTFDLSPLQQTSNYEEHIAFLDGFREHFADVVKSLPKKGDKRLAVFIDDLDRCSPERTVEVLDAIKLFVDIEGCVYILGLDLDIVQQAVATKYKDDPLAQREYLGKIIQLPFQLPLLTRNEMGSYLGKLAIQWPDSRCEKVFLEGLVVNLREVKRTINIFSLLWTLALTREELQGKITSVRLAKVVVIQHAYPKLHKLVQQDPSLLAQLETYYRQPPQEPGGEPTEMVERGYLSELLQVLTDRFSLDEIRDICFALSITYEDLPGEAKNAKARELLTHLERRGRISELIEYIKQERPDVDLSKIEQGIKTGEHARAVAVAVGFPEELQPFMQLPTLRKMLLLHDLIKPEEDDANFASMEPEAIRVYFTLTSQAETVTKIAYETLEASSVIGDRYRIIQEISKGWMSTTYLVEDQTEGGKVVSKVLDADTIQDDIYIEQFNKQIESLYRLDHPNIVRLIDDGSFGNNRYFIMEYLSGGNLRGSLARAGRLTLSAAMDVMLPILDALAYIHRAGYVHGNVRPNVILFDAQGIAKLAGFSVVKTAGESWPKGYIFGSLTYNSPEQNLGIHDGRADLYSAGVVLYKCLTGQPPFEASERAKLMELHASESPPPPRSINPNIPTAVEKITLKLLEKDPDNRYPRAEIVRDDLLEAVEDTSNPAADGVGVAS